MCIVINFSYQFRINNCGIKNMVDWINRIQVQCPSIEYLSIMGNPGIKEKFSYCTLNMFNNLPNVESTVIPTNIVADYREYVLQMLPNLQYLDGVPRNSLLQKLQCPLNDVIPSTSSPSVSSGNSLGNGSSSQGQHCNGNGNRKISSSLSFKDLFRIKRRKTSYPSSSTN